MAEPSRKKRLTLSLSLFTNLSESRTPNVNLGSMNSAKSPRNFERGVVGLGIVAAMNDPKDRSDSMISAKTSRTATFALSPRSQPIPISVPSSVKPGAVSIGGPRLEKGNMEHSESYTCVILNVGNNLIKKREYFDDKVDGCSGATGWNSGMFSASPLSHGKGNSAFAPFRTADFLHSCYLCKRALHGLDIFMYRGEKAFCSVECRYKQISSHEMGRCSASPCSSPTMFSPGLLRHNYDWYIANI